MNGRRQCEALTICHNRGGCGERCLEAATENSTGRWLCWMHHHTALHPETRRHDPLQYVEGAAP